MLTPLDDYLIHQTPDTLDRVATSDRNFYDRYYFNCHDLSGETFLVIAMGVYPNLGVIDAFATCVKGGDRQYVVRASRELGSDRSQTVVGPIGVEVLEGLRLFRVWCDDNQWDLKFDLTFQGVTPPFQEPHFLRHAGPRVVMDYTRLTQPGRWHGDITVGGEHLEVRADTWWGARDHSWGIRPIERAAGGAPVRDGPRGFFWNWAPVQFDHHAIMYTASEDHDGSRWHEAAAWLHVYDSDLPEEPLTLVSHDLRLKPGTRTFDGGRVTLAEPDGTLVELEFEPLSLLHMAGAGYSYQGGLWRHGEYHGELAVEGETWDLNDQELVRRLAGQNETLCRVRHGSRTGYGIFEFILFGLYEPYGFNATTDVARDGASVAAPEPPPAPEPSPWAPSLAATATPAPQPDPPPATDGPPPELRAGSPEPEETHEPILEPEPSSPASRAEQILRARREIERGEPR